MDSEVEKVQSQLLAQRDENGVTPGFSVNVDKSNFNINRQEGCLVELQRENGKELEYIVDFPTVSFYGLHENFFVGYFGEIGLNVNPENNEKYTAFLLKFKVGSEHKFNSKEYDYEIQYYMMKNDGTQCDKLRELHNTAYKQFYKGIDSTVV